MSSPLTKRMKEQYELRSRHYFPRRTYLIVRCDGRAFHTWTRKLEKPYSLNLMTCMDAAAVALCEEAAGCQFAYVQSDEISLLLTDFADVKTEAWFDNCQNKIESVSASIVTMAFNFALTKLKGANPTENELPITKKLPNAVFDARAFVIPDLVEVENYFIERQQDAERNSIMMLARAYASHKQLAGKKRADQHEIIHRAGDNWAKHPVGFKHGRVIRREMGNWVVDDNTPIFTKDREYLRNRIPLIWNDDLIVRKASAGK